MALPATTTKENSSAPTFDPAPWNTVFGGADAQKSPRALNNCYAYFLQDKERALKDSFPQPGALAAVRAQMNAQRRGRYSQNNESNNRLHPKTDPYECSTLIEAIRADNPLIFATSRFRSCPHNYYKGFLAVDNRNPADSDYHFWILNDDGKWSHKPGGNNVTALDSAGNVITDPMTSDRGRYNEPCAFFCVPANAYAPTYSTGYSAGYSTGVVAIKK
jgi:hypothetical protein